MTPRPGRWTDRDIPRELLGAAHEADREWLFLQACAVAPYSAKQKARDYSQRVRHYTRKDGTVKIVKG
jgi:hypothetical protein